MGMGRLIDRVKYRAIKKFTFEQMVDFVTTLYIEGYKTAAKDLADKIQVVDDDKLEKDIKELIRKEFGIGNKRYTRALMADKIKESIDACLVDMNVSDIEVKIRQSINNAGGES